MLVFLKLTLQLHLFRLKLADVLLVSSIHGLYAVLQLFVLLLQLCYLLLEFRILCLKVVCEVARLRQELYDLRLGLVQVARLLHVQGSSYLLLLNVFQSYL